MELHIGIDDTDSTKGGCTTYIAARLVEDLAKAEVRFIDYPNIIRLNPNIPYKTRGNAAVALRIEIPKEAYELVQETVLHEVEKNSRVGEANTDPAVVLLKGHPTRKIWQLSRKSLGDIVTANEALRAVRVSGATALTYGTRLGLVGALAAVGQTLDGDHTFELVAYRDRKNWGKPRRVNEDSVKKMDGATAPRTFNNYDYENNRMLVTPHGPDPVLLGIRGESSQAVLKAFRMLKIHEPVERWIIFRTNHGTDSHFENGHAKERVRPNAPVVLSGVVAGRPERIPGGHVFFVLRYNRGNIRCAAFEPTGKLREAASRLLPGDEVTVYGGVKSRENLPVAINLEKIFIHRLVDELRFENPTCPKCRKHMKSSGKGQGFRCERCSLVQRNAEKRIARKLRALQTGLHVPDRKALRHLTKPLSRYGLEKKSWNHSPPSGRWHDP